MAISGIGCRGGFDPRIPFFTDNLHKPAPVLGRVRVQLSFKIQQMRDRPGIEITPCNLSL